MLTYADSNQNALSPTAADAQQHAFSRRALGGARVEGAGEADAQQHAFSPTALAAAAAASVTGAVGAAGVAGVAGVAGGGSRADGAQAPAVAQEHIVHNGAGAGAVFFIFFVWNRLLQP